MKQFIVLLLFILSTSSFAHPNFNEQVGTFARIDGPSIGYTGLFGPEPCAKNLEVIEITCDQEGEDGNPGLLVRQLKVDAWGHDYPIEMTRLYDKRFCNINKVNPIKVKSVGPGTFLTKSIIKYEYQSKIIERKQSILLKKTASWKSYRAMIKQNAGVEETTLDYQYDYAGNFKKIIYKVQGVWFEGMTESRPDLRGFTYCEFN